jgi:apolipoprotein D and lipocalin family protein
MFTTLMPRVAVVMSALLMGSAYANPSIPELEVAGYMGRWYQLALYPNRFQKQCLSDSSAQYRLLDDKQIEVINRCKTTEGSEVVNGIARPRGSVVDGGKLKPASLQVAFAPTWTRWLSAVWGDYDVVQLLEGGTISIVSESSKEYLWVLSRKPSISQASWATVEAWLKANGYDMQRLKREAHAAP